MFEFSIGMTPTLEELKAFILGVEKEAIKDLRPFWVNRATPVIKEEMARIFATEGYGTWPPLSNRYKEYKRRFFPGKRILRKTDVYFRATTRKGAGNIHIYNADGMVWGVDLGYFANRFGFPYPAAHEKGTKDGRIPARPVFSTAEQSQVLQNNLAASMIKYLDEVVKRETKKHFGKK